MQFERVAFGLMGRKLERGGDPFQLRSGKKGEHCEWLLLNHGSSIMTAFNKKTDYGWPIHTSIRRKLTDEELKEIRDHINALYPGLIVVDSE